MQRPVDLHHPHPPVAPAELRVHVAPPPLRVQPHRLTYRPGRAGPRGHAYAVDLLQRLRPARDVVRRCPEHGPVPDLPHLGELRDQVLHGQQALLHGRCEQAARSARTRRPRRGVHDGPRQPDHVRLPDGVRVRRRPASRLVHDHVDTRQRGNEGAAGHEHVQPTGRPRLGATWTRLSCSSTYSLVKAASCSTSAAADCAGGTRLGSGSCSRRSSRYTPLGVYPVRAAICWADRRSGWRWRGPAGSGGRAARRSAAAVSLPCPPTLPLTARPWWPPSGTVHCAKCADLPAPGDTVATARRGRPAGGAGRAPRPRR